MFSGCINIFLWSWNDDSRKIRARAERLKDAFKEGFGMGERYGHDREAEEFRSACTLVEVGQISCSSSQSFLCQARAPMFPLRPGSWKWAGRANKQRGGAYAHQTNTFTYVYSHKLKRIYTNNYMLKLKELYMRTFATPSHLYEEADIVGWFPLMCLVTDIFDFQIALIFQQIVTSYYYETHSWKSL